MTKIQYDYELIAATSREKEKRLLVVGVDLCDERNDLPKQHRCHTLIAPMDRIVQSSTLDGSSLCATTKRTASRP